MKIQSIGSNFLPVIQQNNITTPIKQNLLQSDIFTHSSKPSFTGYCVDKKKFNIIGQPPEKLAELADVFYKESDYDIKKACKTRYGNILIDVFKTDGQEKYNLAYNQFLPIVNSTRKRAKKVEHRIAKLSELATKGDSNIAEHKQFIERTFFDLLKVEQSGRKIPNCNGILIFGEAPTVDKQEFVDWFKKNVPARIEEYTYDETEPFESIKRLVETAKNAEEAYQVTGQRTIIHLNDLEKLLTDEESRQSRKIMARFKQFAESCSENYHTTLFMVTNHPLEDFEDASIASHRFDGKFRLNDGIKPEQKEELAQLKEEQEKREKAASEVEKYFWYEDNTPITYASDGPEYGSHEWCVQEAQFRM